MVTSLIASTSIESPETTKGSSSLSILIFKRCSAKLSLSPHCPYDCAIDLLPGTTTPQNRIYLLSRTEQEAMEVYFKEALAGYIAPLPASAGFFFVEYKGGGLRPCIDYHGLDLITVKYPSTSPH